MMFLYSFYNYCAFLTTIWLWFLFSIIKQSYCEEIFVSKAILSSEGTQYIPANMPAQLISITNTDSIKKCAILCNNNVLCRVFDYAVFSPKQCRLFEGDTNRLGQILSSSSSQSQVGTLQLSARLFAEYGSACISTCNHIRYLRCGSNSTCECMPHTYWNASISMCIPQLPILGASCQQNLSMCREDLNYTCLQFNQCGPLSVLSGTTIVNQTTKITNSTTDGLNSPLGIDILGTNSDSIIIVDMNNNRIVGLWDADTNYKNISVVATEWASGQPLNYPYDVYVNARNGCDIYVTNYGNPQVVLYSNMQTINPLPSMVAGLGYGGPGLDRLNAPFGVVVDRNKNIIVASMLDHRIMFWPPNALSGTIIVGHISAINGNTSMDLDTPLGIALDEHNSWLYVADSNNHRIQRYNLNDTWPCSGTTVAGGNGSGPRSNQLSYPSDVKISNKTGALYIVDSNNNRIQRFNQRATEGVTIAGDLNGNPGANDTMFNSPAGLAINRNETLMYVTDQSNNRVQRFELI
ncbi:unnamed protein product [Adineta steineri]|uniref:Apple domain-containing protein n=1 Tax=Adineta steineri TaxID=433720 RepID=A0A814NMS8_9BILA|nr:unnamed protein product [Adineta steineri]CAF3777958.1 unnamed protein product [Adineta steineri]